MNDDYRSPTERVRAALADGALHIRLDHPTRHNALSVDMWQALPPLLAEAGTDERVRLVLFSGAGDKAFASGADISEFADQRAAREAVTRYEALAEAALAAVQGCAKPTLAAIRGWCIGGGVNLALACDIRIAADDAVFAIPAARLGLGYRFSAMKNLVDLIGPGAARDLFFTARRVGAAEAQSLGLVSRVVPAADYAARVDETVRAIADNAPLTLRAGKATIAEILKPSPELDRDRCEALIRGCFDSADYAEGRRAFVDKRRPVFTGH